MSVDEARALIGQAKPPPENAITQTGRPPITFPEFEGYTPEGLKLTVRPSPGREEPPRVTPIDPTAPENVAFTVGANAREGRIDQRVALRGVEGMPQSLSELTGRPTEGTAQFGRDVVAGKRAMTADDARELERETKSSVDQRPKPPPEELPVLDPETGAPIDGSAVPDVFKATLAGVMQGARDVPLGMAQTVGEQVAPEQTRELTNRVNEMDEKLAGMTGNHPWAHEAGYIIGTTAGLVAGGELLGGLKVAQVAGRLLPEFLTKSGILTRAVGDYTISATQYNSNPDESSRLLEGTIGAIGGPLIRSIGNSVISATRTLADKNWFNTAMAVLRENVGDMSASTSKLRDTFVEHFKGTLDTSNELYTLRNRAGQELAQGFEREPLTRVVGDVKADTRGAGVSVRQQVDAAAAQAEKELGGDEARALEAAHGARVQQYEKDLAEWSKLTQDLKEPGLSRLIQQGQVPPPPMSPGEFVPPQVTSQQLSAALESVQHRINTTSDRATINQLTKLKTGIEGQAADIAAEAGMSTAEFFARAKKAGEFYKENVVPIRKKYGKRSTPQSIEEDVTRAAVYNDARSLIRGNDVEALQKFKKMWGGDRAQPELVKVAMRDMLTSVEKTGGKSQERRFVDYVHEHKDMLRELVGRDGVEHLEGAAKVAQALLDEPKKWSRLHSMLAHHGWLQAIGAVEVVRGAWHGDMPLLAQGGAMIALPFAGEVLYNMITKMEKVPAMLPIMRRASKLRPGSPEFNKLMNVATQRVMIASRVAARTASPVGNVGAPMMPQGIDWSFGAGP